MSHVFILDSKKNKILHIQLNSSTPSRDLLTEEYNKENSLIKEKIK